MLKFKLSLNVMVYLIYNPKFTPFNSILKKIFNTLYFIWYSAVGWRVRRVYVPDG